MGWEVLEELDPDRAEQWRDTIQQDEVRQRQQSGAAGGGGGRHSEVYIAGLPQRPAGLMDLLEGGATASSGNAGN